VHAAFVGLSLLGAPARAEESSQAQKAAPALAAKDEPLFSVMRAELGRSTSELRLPNAGAPYYAAYWVADLDEHDIEATLGVLVSDSTLRTRFIRVETRVGSREFDNSNFVGVGSDDGEIVIREADLVSPRAVPIDDDGSALRRELWLATDAAYKAGVESLGKKRAHKQAEVALRPELPSFSDQSSARVVVADEPPMPAFDAPKLARETSAVFRKYAEVERSTAHVLVSSSRRRFAANDGGFAVEPARFTALEITCSARAKDGMQVERNAVLVGKGGGPPDERTAIEEAKRLAEDVTSLKTAEVADDYSGPVLFEGKAAAQLAFDLLGDSLSGTPAPMGNEALESPLSLKLGKRVMPKGFSVFDDPTLSSYEGFPLLGHYAVDDEGIQAERASLVEDGRLKGFLMSRAPREGIARSNGHGRSGLMGWARGRPANLIVRAKEGLSKRDLRSRLAKTVREQGAAFGLLVTDLAPRVSASNGEAIPAPEVIYRVSPDGKETLLRGAQFTGMTVRDLREVIGAGRDLGVYSFVAESDGGLDVSVSVVAPSLLFEDIEVRGPTTPSKRPPVVPRPDI
jgi:predicted Zn-dependent protease